MRGATRFADLSLYIAGDICTGGDRTQTEGEYAHSKASRLYSAAIALRRSLLAFSPQLTRDAQQDVCCLSSSDMASAEAAVQGIPLRDINDEGLQVTLLLLLLLHLL